MKSRYRKLFLKNNIWYFESDVTDETYEYPFCKFDLGVDNEEYLDKCDGAYNRTKDLNEKSYYNI